MEQIEGTVQWFKNQYGFIRPDNGGKDVFCHHSAIVADGYRSLRRDSALALLYLAAAKVRRLKKCVCYRCKMGLWTMGRLC